MVGKMAIMDQTGDTRLEWDGTNKTEVDIARTTFNSLKAKGYVAYDVSGSKRGARIDKFNASLESIIMVPELIGHDATLALER